MIFKRKNNNKLIAGAAAGATGAFVLIVLFKKISQSIKKWKRSRQEQNNREIKVLFDNSKLKNFVNEATSAIEKDYENLDCDITAREIVRPLYANQVENLNLLSTVKAKQTKKSFVKLNSFDSLSILLFVTLLSSLVVVVSLLDKGLMEKYIKLDLIAKLSAFICFSLVLICFIALIVKKMILKNAKPEVVLEIDIPLDIQDKKFGIHSENLLLKLKSDTKKLCENLDNGVQIADEKLVRDVSKLYCDINEAVVLKSQNNIEKDVFPTFKQVLSKDLKLLVIEKYDNKTEKFFDIQNIDMGESKIIQPAIITQQGKIVARGKYLKRI